MPLPGFKQTIKDGGLGLIAADAGQTKVAIGVSSAGPVNVLAFYTDPDKVKADYVTGPLVDDAVFHLQTAGGQIGIMRITSSVAGANGSVTATRAGAGTSTGTVTPSGTPLDGYAFRVEITKDGANLAAATATFKYSVDGGDNYSPDIAVPTGGTYVIPNTGVTITFANGGATAFVTGDVHAWTATAPGFSATNVSDALDALRTTYKSAEFGYIHLIGAASSAAGSATIAAAAGVKMTAEENGFRYTFIVIECADDTDANIDAAFASVVHERVALAVGYCELVANNKVMKRSAAWPATARISQQGIQRDLGRTRPDTEGGALKGVVSLYRDEGSTPFSSSRYITLRTFPGKAGFYITDGRMLAGAGSDFLFMQFRRLMDRACALNYDAMFPFINDDAVRVEKDGTINEIDARGVESVVNAKIRGDMVPKKVSAARSILTRDNNILATQTFKTKVRLRPRGYAKYIESEIGYENPALIPT